MDGIEITCLFAPLLSLLASIFDFVISLGPNAVSITSLV